MEAIVAGLVDLSNAVDGLTSAVTAAVAAEAAEVKLAPGEVAVSQAELDAVIQRVADATTAVQGLASNPA